MTNRDRQLSYSPKFVIYPTPLHFKPVLFLLQIYYKPGELFRFGRHKGATPKDYHRGKSAKVTVVQITVGDPFILHPNYGLLFFCYSDPGLNKMVMGNCACEKSEYWSKK